MPSSDPVSGNAMQPRGGPAGRTPPYSIRDVPRLHARNLALARPEHHWTAPRIVVDATEDEFHAQAKKEEGGGGGKKADGTGAAARLTHLLSSFQKPSSDEDQKCPEEDQQGPKGERKPSSEEKRKSREKAQGPREDTNPSSEEGQQAPKPDQEHADAGKKRPEPDPNAPGLYEAQLIRAISKPGARNPTPPSFPLTDIDNADTGTPDNWVPRLTSETGESLTRLTGSHPLNAEPKLADLLSDGLLTSTFRHYVRNHGPVPFLEWETHSVFVRGPGLEAGKEVGMDEIAGMGRAEFPVTFCCDGFRRSELNKVRRTQGFDMGAGTAGTAVWGGVPLRTFLLALFPDLDKRETSQLHVHFEGTEDLANGKYGTSLPLDYVLDAGNDCMLAYTMNGLPLPPDHGYPIRTILPGMVGGRTVKWLRKIEIADRESDNWYHRHDNRLYPEQVKDVGDVERVEWHLHPDTVITQLPLQSVIVHPAPGTRLPLSQLSAASATYKLRGFAFAGSGQRVSKVSVLLSGASLPATWRYAPRTFLPDSMRHGTKHWTWCHWELDVPAAELLACEEVRVRAFDAGKNTQPEESVFDLGGYMGNGHYVVKPRIVPAGEGGGEACLLFLHPTDTSDPGNGWMEPSAAVRIESAKAAAGTADLKEMSWDEVKKHAKRDDMWIVIDGVVYDVTDFASKHPGGTAPLASHAGQDVSFIFASIHDDRARSMASSYAIGRVSSPEPGARPTRAPHEATEGDHAIHPGRWVSCSLVRKEGVSHDVRRFTFRLPGGGRLALPTGKHLRIGVHFKDKMVQRMYTPTRPILPEEEDGTFDLVVKIYLPNTDPRYPPGGLISNYLDTMEPGDRIDVRGPEGYIEYDGNGKLNVSLKDLVAKRISLVAGGSGITPIFQLIRRILSDPDDPVRMRFVFANKTPSDIILRAELDRLAAENRERFEVMYSVDKEPQGEDASGIAHVGHVDAGVLGWLFLPGRGGEEEAVALVCGPPRMIEKGVVPGLEKLGYEREKNLFVF
ncbi:hypothetical protein DFJ74DRAFT_48693 [Hyaloraphidium curvatum]|nr:hypothetical protein DFJ74DRAFT_48693 [Hyaloraphidium curvatum]